MNRYLFLLGIAVMLIFSGCGTKAQSSAAAQQPTAQAVAQAPTGGSAAAAAATAPAQDAGKPAEVVPDAGLPAEAAAKPEPATAAPAKPAAAKPEAKPQAASPAADPAAPAPAAAAAQPSAGIAAAPAEPAPPAPADAATPDKAGVKISIAGGKKRGVILKEMAVPFKEGMTVLDVLKQVTKDNKLQMEFQGKGAYTYVQGIDNLYELDEGPKSGWIYKVNGLPAGESAGSKKVAAGDKIEWLYTLDLGADVGAKVK